MNIEYPDMKLLNSIMSQWIIILLWAIIVYESKAIGDNITDSMPIDVELNKLGKLI